MEDHDTSPTTPAPPRNVGEQLRAARLQLAKAQNLPPYVIFHDKTLREMAQRRPATLEEFVQIGGVGEKKAERYGEVFLEALRAYAAA